MAQKKGLAKTVRKRRPKKSGSTAVAKNPPEESGLAHDMQHYVLPGFGAYAVNRFLSRVAFKLAHNWKPGAAPHAAALSTVLGAGAAYYVPTKVEQLEAYQQPAMLGAGIAALQTIAQTYLPGYGWIVSDLRDDDYSDPPSDSAPEKSSATRNGGSSRSAPAAGDAETGDDSGADSDLDDLAAGLDADLDDDLGVGGSFASGF